jgi:hypothetical protein
MFSGPGGFRRDVVVRFAASRLERRCKRDLRISEVPRPLDVTFCVFSASGAGLMIPDPSAFREGFIYATSKVKCG